MPSVKSEITLPKNAFSKVREAREVLRQRASELIDKYLQVVDFAIAKGDAESAYKALQWLIDHIPADDDGTRIVDRSVDKVPTTIEIGNKQPAIQIGIALGGLPRASLPGNASKQKALPKPKVKVIDAKSS